MKFGGSDLDRLVRMINCLCLLPIFLDKVTFSAFYSPTPPLEMQGKTRGSFFVARLMPRKGRSQRHDSLIIAACQLLERATDQQAGTCFSHFHFHSHSCMP